MEYEFGAVLLQQGLQLGSVREAFAPLFLARYRAVMQVDDPEKILVLCAF